MRIAPLIVMFVVLTQAPVAAQGSVWSGAERTGKGWEGQFGVPIGSATGLRQLERLALAGDRRASALLAVLLQDLSEIEGNLVTSALHFQVAIAAGCMDLRGAAEGALARLSAEQRDAYQEALPRWLPPEGTVAQAPVSGRCLSWLGAWQGPGF